MLLRQDGKAHAFTGLLRKIKDIVSLEVVDDTDCGHQHWTEWCPAEQGSALLGAPLLPWKPPPKP